MSPVKHRLITQLGACVLLVLSSMAFSDEASTYWIDVRSANEFADEHHPLAVNIPHTEIAEHIAGVTNDKNADIRVYCRSGRRSGIAKEALEALGYSRVTNEGGINDVLEE